MTHKMKFRLRRVEDDMLEVTVFSGYDERTKQNCGTLRLHIGEWQTFGAALLFGQERMQGHFLTETEGQESALAQQP